MRTEIKKWGNSAALRLSRDMLAKAGLEIDSAVDIDAAEGKLVITAASAPTYVLDDLLADCPPGKVKPDHTDQEWLQKPPVGGEIL